MLFVVWLEAVSVLWDGFKRSNLPFNLSKLISPPSHQGVARPPLKPLIPFLFIK